MLRRSLNLLQSRQEHYQAKLGFYLLLVSLGIFFISSMIAYTVIAKMPSKPVAAEQSLLDSNEQATASGEATNANEQPATFRGRHVSLTSTYTENARRKVIPLKLPSSFMISTVVLLSVSLVLHRAVENVHQERQQQFRVCLIVGLVLAFGFCLAQCFGLNDLIMTHSQRGNGDAKLYGISFTLALVHALHVVGGLGFLWFVTMRGLNNVYDHERHYAVDLCATYWHFLDGIWIVMLATFLLSTPV